MLVEYGLSEVLGKLALAEVGDSIIAGVPSPGVLSPVVKPLPVWYSSSS
jgi:hypothetical protein